MTNLHTEHQAIFEAFLAERRTKHLDFRMEDTGETPPADDAGTGETPPADDKGQKPELTLEQALAEVSKVRGEAAGYRTRLREAEGKLAGAKTPEDVAAAVAEFQSKNAELERALLVQKVAAKHSLPETLAARLQGDDETALDADAKTLAALVVISGTTPESLSGGLTPGESDDTFDPVAAAKAARARRY